MFANERLKGFFMTEMQWYMVVLRRWSALIVVGTLLAAGVGLLISLILPQTYTASSDVLILKSRFDVDLDPRAGALSEDEILRFNNFDARRQTLFTLASSQAVLSATIAALPESYQAGWDMDRLASQGNVKTPGSLVQLIVADSSPEVAAVVSRAWAAAFVTQINQVYNQTAPPTSLQEQLPLAQMAYEQAQQALEQFLNTSQLDELKLGVAWREGSLHAWQNATLASTSKGVTAYLAAEQQVPLWLESAYTLRAQLAAWPAADPLPSALVSSLLILQAGIANGTNLTPLELQVSPADNTTLTVGEALAAVDSLLGSLTELQVRLRAVTAAETAGWLMNPAQDPLLGDPLAALQAELDELRAQLEEETARQRELTAARDLAWETYQLLQKQSVESDLLEAAPATEVALAAPAVTPTTPSGPNIALNTAIGGLLGLTVTLLLTFILEQLRTAPTTYNQQNSAQPESGLSE